MRFRVAEYITLAGACAAAFAAQAQLSSQSLAAANATIDFCAAADPAHADAYRQRAALFSSALDGDAIAALKSSAEYKAAYDATRASLAKQPQAESQKTCLQMAKQDE